MLLFVPRATYSRRAHRIWNLTIWPNMWRNCLHVREKGCNLECNISQTTDIPSNGYSCTISMQICILTDKISCWTVSETKHSAKSRGQEANHFRWRLEREFWFSLKHTNMFLLANNIGRHGKGFQRRDGQLELENLTNTTTLGAMVPGYSEWSEIGYSSLSS